MLTGGSGSFHSPRKATRIDNLRSFSLLKVQAIPDIRTYMKEYCFLALQAYMCVCSIL